MNRITTVAGGVALAFAVSACGGGSRGAAVTPQGGGVDGAKAASLVIRHQTRGCHAWSLNGSAFEPRQSASLLHGNGMTITDDDVMPHTLVQTAGPVRVRIAGAYMHRMGARARLVFPAHGTYRFTTRAGEDYTSGVETVGADNVLRLTVHVS